MPDPPSTPPPTSPATPGGIWQGITGLFASGPVSRVVQLVLGSDLHGFLARLAKARQPAIEDRRSGLVSFHGSIRATFFQEATSLL